MTTVITTKDPGTWTVMSASHLASLASSATAGQLDDVTNGATYYYVKDTPMPRWAKIFNDAGEQIGVRTSCAEIGHHLFFKDIA